MKKILIYLWFFIVIAAVGNHVLSQSLNQLRYEKSKATTTSRTSLLNKLLNRQLGNTFIPTPHRGLHDVKWMTDYYKSKAYSANSPENSLRSINYAWEQGFHMVELDVRVDKDGVPFLNHDKTLGRTVDNPKISFSWRRSQCGGCSPSTLPCNDIINGITYDFSPTYNRCSAVCSFACKEWNPSLKDLWASQKFLSSIARRPFMFNDSRTLTDQRLFSLQTIIREVMRYKPLIILLDIQDQETFNASKKVVLTLHNEWLRNRGGAYPGGGDPLKFVVFKCFLSNINTTTMFANPKLLVMPVIQAVNVVKLAPGEKQKSLGNLVDWLINVTNPHTGRYKKSMVGIQVSYWGTLQYKESNGEWKNKNRLINYIIRIKKAGIPIAAFQNVPHERNFTQNGSNSRQKFINSVKNGFYISGENGKSLFQRLEQPSAPFKFANGKESRWRNFENKTWDIFYFLKANRMFNIVISDDPDALNRRDIVTGFGHTVSLPNIWGWKRKVITYNPSAATTLNTATTATLNTASEDTTFSATGEDSVRNTLFVQAKHSNKFLVVDNENKLPNGKVKQFDSINKASFHFVFQGNGDGYFTITNTNSGLNLAITSSTPGSFVTQQNKNDNNDNQLWQINEAIDSGYYNIMSKSTGLCLEVQGASTQNNAFLVANYSSGLDNQAFSFTGVQQALSDGIYIIRNVANNLSLSSGYNSNSPYDTVKTQAYNNTQDNQKWQISYNADGYYTINNINSNRNLTVNNASLNDKANLFAKDDSDEQNQCFYIREVSADTSGNQPFLIQPMHSFTNVLNKTISINNTSIGSTVVQKQYLNATSQQWYFELIEDSATTEETVFSPPCTLKQLPGLAKQITANRDHLGIIGTNDCVYIWDADSTRWRYQNKCSAIDYALDNTGNPWYVNTQNIITNYVDSTDTWQTLPGKLLKIAVSPYGHVAGIGMNNQVYEWSETDNSWNSIGGYATEITVDNEGNPWIIGTGNSISKWGPNDDDSTISWHQLPGSAKKITTGVDGNTYVIGMNNSIYHWNSKSWDVMANMPNNLVEIALLDSNKLVGIDVNNKIWKSDCDGNIATFSNNNVVTTIDDLSSNTSNLKIFPNPTTGIVNIQLPENMANAKIKVESVLGAVVATNNANATKRTLNLSGKPKGVYIVKIIAEDGKMTTKKIVLQ